MFSEDVLNRSNLEVEITDPFFIFEFKEVFPEDIYNELDRQFPEKVLFPKSHENHGKKSYLDSKMPLFFEFIDTAPSWAQLYEHFCKPKVISRFFDMARTVESERPKSQTKEWRLVVDPRRTVGLNRVERLIAGLNGKINNYTPVRVVFELSYLDDGCYIPPHTDIPKKLLSLLIYFPDAGADYGGRAGTEFYRGRGGAPAWSGWKAGMLPDKEAAEFYADHETFYTSRFEPNKLVGFVKSSNSWHGIHQLDLGPGVARRSLNINYFTV